MVGCLASVGSACIEEPDCDNGGPTTEWPNRSRACAAGDSEGEGTSGPPKHDPGPDRPQDQTSRDAGASKPSSQIDAGKGGGGAAPSPVDAEPDEVAGDGGTPPDAGAADGGAWDAGGVTLDGGVDAGGNATCTPQSDGRDAGACYGVYCATPPHALAAQRLSVGGACLEAKDLELVCDGELSRVVDACAQEDALRLGLGSTVSECARDARSLAKASQGCIDCHVDEVLCAVESCLTPCLAGLAAACIECRATHCGEAFRDCSGLAPP